MKQKCKLPCRSNMATGPVIMFVAVLKKVTSPADWLRFIIFRSHCQKSAPTFTVAVLESQWLSVSDVYSHSYCTWCVFFVHFSLQAKYLAQIIVMGAQVVGRAFARALQQEYAGMTVKATCLKCVLKHFDRFTIIQRGHVFIDFILSLLILQ